MLTTSAPTQAGTLQDMLSCLAESLLPVALYFLHLRMEELVLTPCLVQLTDRHEGGPSATA